MNRKVLITLFLVGLIALAGCAETQQGKDQGKELANDTGNNLEGVTPGESYYYEIKMTEKNQMHLVKKRPPFLMEDSLERQNLIRRYKYLNDQNNQHHVYLYNHGTLVSYFVAQGKVSSVNSKLTNDKQIVKIAGCDWGGNPDNEGTCYRTVESPQMDGSYGTNGDAIFFFTTAGHYVEWNGKYLVSEQPLGVTEPVQLTHEIESENKSDVNETA